MTFWLFSLFAIPLWCVFFYLYFKLRKEKLFQTSLVPKAGGSFLALASAGIALSIAGGNPLGRSEMWFFIFCIIGDVILELSFMPGMGFFALGHIMLIIHLWQYFSLTAAVIWTAALVISTVLFRRELPAMRFVAIPCCLYVGILSATMALGISALIKTGDMSMLPLSIGTVSFFISDMMVAKCEFNQQGDRLQKPIMVTYWGALFLIASVLWR